MSTFGSASGIRAGQAYVEVGADTSQLQKQIVDGVTKALNQNAGGLGSNLSVLRQLSELRYVDCGVQGLAQMTTEAIKFKEEFDAGGIGAGEMVDKIMSAVPWLGQWWQLGRNIHELFTGDNEELNKTLDYVSQLGALMDELQKGMAGGKSILQDWNKQISEMVDHLTPNTTKNRFQKEADEDAENLAKAHDEKLKQIQANFTTRVAVNNLTGTARILSTGTLPLDKTAETEKEITNPAELVRLMTTTLRDAQSNLATAATENANAVAPQPIAGDVPPLPPILTDLDPLRENVANTQNMLNRAMQINKEYESEINKLNLPEAISKIKAAAASAQLNDMAEKFSEFWKKFQRGATKAMNKSEEELKKVADEQAEAARKKAEQLKETGAAQFDLARSLETPAERLKEVTKELDQLLARHIIGNPEYQRALKAIDDTGQHFSSQGVESGFGLQSIQSNAEGVNKAGSDIGERIAGQIDRLISMLHEGFQFN